MSLNPGGLAGLRGDLQRCVDGEVEYLTVDQQSAHVLVEAIRQAEEASKPGPFGSARQPRIEDRCPACGVRSLFIGTGGHLTCANLRCANPGVTSAIEELRSTLEDALLTLIAIAAQPATAGRLWADNPTLGATLVRVRKALRLPDEPDPLRRFRS